MKFRTAVIAGLCGWLWTVDDPNQALANLQNGTMAAVAAIKADPSGWTNRVYTSMEQSKALHVILGWVLCRLLVRFFKNRIERDEALAAAAAPAPAPAPAAAAARAPRTAPASGGSSKKKR